MDNIKNTARLLIISKIIIVILVLCFTLANSVYCSDLVKYSLCDIQVLYIFEDQSEIDWPVIYYLNDNYGCRIDLLTIIKKASKNIITSEIKEKEIYLHKYYVTSDDSSSIISIINNRFIKRRPDIVVYGYHKGNKLYHSLEEYITNLESSPSSFFNILKIYRKYDNDNENISGAVFLNSQELLNRYRNRIELEVRTIFPHFAVDSYQAEHIARFQLIENNFPQDITENNFLSGIEQFRLTNIIDHVFQKGPMKETLLKQAGKFVSFFRSAQNSSGKEKVDFIVDGYRELKYLNRHESVITEYPKYQEYLQSLLSKAEKAARKAVGISWAGKIILRDSPHGPKIKFRVSVSANGPEEIKINNFRFHPFWDTTFIELDTASVNISPHQTYVKEFLVEIDRGHLQGAPEDSLKFSVEVNYKQNSLLFTDLFPVWQTPDLTIKFMPDFSFIKPFKKLEVDRVVSSLKLKAIISKPYDFAGTVQINLKTPRGLFAGAYRKDIKLDKGTLLEFVQIPFTISNLFERGVQKQMIELLIDKKPVSADTARIRIASCKIPDTVRIGFLPDKNGLLEDILNMTDAAFRPMTNRSLMTAELDAYNVIIIGTGAFKELPDFVNMRNRFEDYLRQGGSLVILQQPEDWLADVLPFSFVPVKEIVSNQNITNMITGAKILRKPYSISEKNLLSSFYKKREVFSAVITPAEKVLVTPSGGTLLSVSRLGKGQMIYCGLPLLELISKLDIDAIHLFANILNY